MLSREDLWLCTLLLNEGWRIEYCAESDAFAHAPEGFYEFYNQRRRWSPSTIDNIPDLIVHWKIIKKNQNISSLYIIFQMMLFVSGLLAPGLIFMMIFGAITIVFESILPWLALLVNAFPIGLFWVMCLYASTKRQVRVRELFQKCSFYDIC